VLISVPRHSRPAVQPNADIPFGQRFFLKTPVDDAARMRVNLRFDKDRVPCGLPVPSTRKKGTLQIDRVKNKEQNTRQKFDTQKTYLIRRQHHNHPPESLAGHRRHKRGRVIMEYVEHVVPRGALFMSVAASTLEGGRDRGNN
jgi:hypothetical protein